MYLFHSRHYTNAKFLELLERLYAVLYPSLDSVSVDTLPLLLSQVYEMVVSHSAFVPSMLSKTSTDVKG